MATEALLDDFVPTVMHARFPEIERMSSVQKKAFYALINRRDVFAILPTGHGKSLIFEMIPDVCSELSARGLPYPKRPIVLVVCPLKSLIDSHIRELTKRGITAVSLTAEGDGDENGILRGKYSFVFGSPEALLNNEKWRAMLQSNVYQERLFAIVTDEAHVIPKWGYGTTNKKEHVSAFRQAFSRLGELRSLGPQHPSAPVLALTATASKISQASVMKSLCMKADCLRIYVSPDRPNIYLSKVKVTMDAQKSFKFLVDKLRLETITMERTFVYCKSIKDCGRLFQLFKSELGEESYYPLGAPKKSENLLFGMYHHTTMDKHQSRVLNSFHDEHGTCRVVFATNALGMGINFSDVRMVINYGPPRDMEGFIQEIGRAGRDGMPAQAVLLFTSHHLQNCEQSVKEYCTSTSGCLRKKLLADFESVDVSDNIHGSDGHKCCLHCHREFCAWGEEGCGIKVQNYDIQEKEDQHEKQSRKVTKEQKDLLKELLSDYQQHASAGLLSYLNAECTTAFTDTLIKAVLKHAKYIFTLDYILVNLPVFKTAHAFEILCMVQDVFEDVDATEFNCEGDSFVTDNNSFCENYDLEYGGIYEEEALQESEDDELSSDED